MLLPLAKAIAATNLSVALQNTAWVVPASQSIHIIGLSVLFASAMMINLRLLGVGARGRSVSVLVASLVPWMWRALLVCLLTGALQTFVEPERQFTTAVFWWKMLLIAGMALLTLWLSRTVRANRSQWDSPQRPPVARLFAVASSLAWITVIVFGRLIGYLWSGQP